MSTPSRLIWSALSSSARLATVSSILLFLPLTLSALSPPAFLLLSFLLTIHSLIHSTIRLVLPTLAPYLPFLQVPVHPFLLLFSFNLFSSTSALVPWLFEAAKLWGKALRLWTPVFVWMEGMASVIVVQATGRTGRVLAERSEEWQVGLLVGAASAYVASATWIVWCYSSIATTPLSSTLLGVALTALIFLTLIGFAQRRTNVIESSLLALYFAYSVWLCSDEHIIDDGHGGYGSEAYWASWVGAGAVAYAPLLSNLLTHLSKLLSFITHTLPKPLLVSLLYRLLILQLASKILPQIGSNSWSDEKEQHGTVEGEEADWEELRPSGKVTRVLLAYRQTIFVTVYSHLLLLDHSSLVWWRWANVFITLTTWAVELLLSQGDDDELVGVSGGVVKGWKMD
ncbi:hypothetical protein M407DRAFT_31953 [Tulasnella calospora MUT 4182]|uniref:Uncharacterized protein n=1 Tax=Tulasnella calospora MUT 4182 TaxID=1051891 RepID=A0A0C3KAH8_9AGAM|nr:hypothetical protein M407DRAFT_31953 [Tulasnella calospora MUT 4182]